MSQLDPSQRRTQIFVETHLCLCDYDGLLADHLRNSKQCVDDLRNQPQLQMTVPNDEVFVVKATIILRGCPAPGCPGGMHQQIPESCLFWWAWRAGNYRQRRLSVSDVLERRELLGQIQLSADEEEGGRAV